MNQEEQSSLHITNSYSISLVENLLKELKIIVQSETFNLDKLTSWIVEHQDDFDNILRKVNNSSRSTFDSHHGVVPVVQEYLFPSFAQQYVPVSTTGDGNCLYHMLSLDLIGTEEYMKHLRLLCAYSLITNQHRMLKLISPIAKLNLPRKDRNAASIARAAEKHWLKVLCDAVEEKVWGNQHHRQALSIVLERAIHVYGIMCHRQVDDEGMRLPPIQIHITSMGLQALFDQQDKRLNNHYRYAPLVNRHLPLSGFFDTGHFTALLPVDESCTVFTPFSTFMSVWAHEV